jgi:hypothetical protein
MATKSTEKFLGDQPRQTEVDSSGLDAVPISITPCWNNDSVRNIGLRLITRTCVLTNTLIAEP